MALNDVTVTFNLTQLLGGDIDTRRTRVYVKTNVTNNTLIDTSTGETRLGDERVTLEADGTGSFTTWGVGADGNPTSWQTYVVVEYPRAGSRDRVTRTFGPYTITDADNGKTLAELEDQQAIPPNYQTAFTEQAQAYLDQQESLAGIDDTDSAVAYNVEFGTQTPAAVRELVAADVADSGSDIGSALSASIDTKASARRSLDGWSLTRHKGALDARRLGPHSTFVLGHSWIEGEGVTAQSDRILDRLRDALRSKYPTIVGGSLVVGGEGYVPIVSFQSTWPNPWVASGGATTDGYGIGGRCGYLDAAGEKFTRNDVFCSSFDFYWLPANGVVKISIDGGAATVLPVAGSSYDVQRWNSGALAVGFHDIVVEWESGTGAYPLGATFFEGDESAGLRIIDSGHNGWTTSNWKVYTGGGGFFTSHYNKLDLPTSPDLIVIMCLVNDYNNSATISPATTQTNLAGIIDDFRDLHDAQGWSRPSFLVVGEIEPTSVLSSTHPWEDYLAAAEAAVVASGDDCAFLNLSAILDTTVNEEGTLAADNLHPSAKGAGWIADVIAQAL